MKRRFYREAEYNSWMRLTRRSFLAGSAAAAAAAPSVPPQQLARDAHRPKYHLLPPANWMNDPNGPIYWRGQYHMFYQYNPNGAFWGTMHWGHAVSPDMVHWRHMPPALAPQAGSYDRDGVFSGCAVVKDGTPTIVYTGTQPRSPGIPTGEVQCLAFARDNSLRHWRRFAGNPVIPHPPEGMEVTGFRDPCVWQEDGAWYMVLGSGIKGVGGVILLYRSPDLVDWSYIGTLFEGKLDPAVKGRGPVANGEMWECPSFFPLGGKHVLFVSTHDTTPYWIGTYKDHKFTPEIEGRLDTGAYYAPITQLDAQKRRVLWGWIQERRPGDAQRAAGWSGVMSLPRVLSVRADGLLGIAPAAQLRSLRGKRQQFVNLFIPENRAEPVPGLEADALELIAIFEPAEVEELGLEILGTPVLYSAEHQRLRIGHATTEERSNLALERNESLRLHVFVDCSVIEVFANGRCAVTGRAYPAPGDRLSVSLVAHGGSAKLQSLTVFEMKPISADRLTT